MNACIQTVKPNLSEYLQKCKQESKRDADRNLMSKLQRSTRMNAKCDEDTTSFAKTVCDNQIPTQSDQYKCLQNLFQEKRFTCISNAKKNATQSYDTNQIPFYDEAAFVRGREDCATKFDTEWKSICTPAPFTTPPSTWTTPPSTWTTPPSTWTTPPSIWTTPPSTSLLLPSKLTSTLTTPPILSTAPSAPSSKSSTSVWTIVVPIVCLLLIIGGVSWYRLKSKTTETQTTNIT